MVKENQTGIESRTEQRAYLANGTDWSSIQLRTIRGSRSSSLQWDNWHPKKIGEYFYHCYISEQLNKNTFMSIPKEMFQINKILNLKRKVTISDIWLLTYLSRLASKDKQRFCWPSLLQMDKALGPSPKKNPNKENRTSNRLKKFSDLRLITLYRRPGKQNIIQVCQSLVDIINRAKLKITKSLVILPYVFLLNLSMPAKTALMLKEGFSRIGINGIANYLDISRMTSWEHLQKIDKIDFSTIPGPPCKTLWDPPAKPYQVYSKVNMYSLSKDKHKVVSPPVDISASLSLEERVPTKINSPTKRNDNMSSEKLPYDTPAPAGWLEKQLYIYKLESSSYKNSRVARKPIKLVNLSNHPLEYVREMDWIKNNCPLISQHTSEKQYKGAIRTIRALALGASNVLRPDEIASLLGYMVGCYIPGYNGGALNEQMIRRIFLDKKFNQEDRRKLYKDLNNAMSVQYGGDGKKKTLESAMRLNNGFVKRWNGWSELTSIAIKPPEKTKEQMPVDISTIEMQMEKAIEVIRKEITKEEKANLARNIIALKKEYMNDYRQRFITGWNGDGMHYGNWPQFFDELIAHFGDSLVFPGWFRPGGNPVNRFMEYIGFDKPVRKPAQESSQMSHATL